MSQPNGDPQSGVTGEGAQSGAGSDPATQDPNNGTGTDGQTGEPQSGPPTGKTYTEADMAAVLARLSAADKNRQAAQDELKKRDQAAMTELERTKAQLAEKEAELAQQKAAVLKKALENAFLTDNTYDWHNSQTALQMLNQEGIEVSEDGTVKGMKAAIEKLSKEHAYLIKPKEGNNDNKGGLTGVSGTRQQSGATDQATMLKRFPSLAGRVAKTN